jgi:hypothetical protein
VLDSSEARPKASPSFNKDRGHVQPLVNPKKSDMDESYVPTAQYPASLRCLGLV